MNQRRRGFVRVLVPWVVVFGIGVGVGFYVRDRQQHELLQDAIENAREEMGEAGLEAIERARRAGAELTAGAEAAAESTKAAFRRLIGGSEN
jgi:hypothetical protein